MRKLLNELHEIANTFEHKLYEIRSFTRELSINHATLHAVAAVVNCNVYNLHRWISPTRKLMEELEVRPSKPTMF